VGWFLQIRSVAAKNRTVLDDMAKNFQIYDAWTDEAWVNEGAAVRVSMTCFAKDKQVLCRLSGEPVDGIYTDLTVKSKQIKIDVTKINQLEDNLNMSFIGGQKNGPFEITGDMAREILTLPLNPNGRPNSDVVVPWVNGSDIVRKPSDTWIIDFGHDTPLETAALYEVPFKYVEDKVKPIRDVNREERIKKYWWLHKRMVPAIREKLPNITRMICTPRVSKHRLFAWIDKRVLPDCATAVFTKDDDFTFGILSSKFHELWSLKLCTWLGKGNDPRYTPTTCFETFPFPRGMEANRPASELAKNPKAQKIAEAAKKIE